MVDTTHCFAFNSKWRGSCTSKYTINTDVYFLLSLRREEIAFFYTYIAVHPEMNSNDAIKILYIPPTISGKKYRVRERYSLFFRNRLQIE